MPIMNSNTPEPDNAKYDAFFEDIEHVLERQVQQKSRGLNDYNIFTSLLKVHDEVRLHSRFLHSLLNPDGAHYQGPLFLELFLDVIGLSDFGLDPHQASVFVEHDNIDLYITDGERHVIIENKIWAEDQPDQIIRYIHSIAQDGIDLVTDTLNGIAQIDGDSVRVVYLTARNEKYEPAGHIVEGGYIMANPKTLRDGVINYRARFHRITYEDDIMRWLRVAQHEVSNLSNLNLVIDQYREVVQRLYRKYKGKVMTFEHYLFDGEGTKQATLRLALGLEKELAKIKGRTLLGFFTSLCDLEIAGELGVLFSDDEKHPEFDDSLCLDWIKGGGKKNAPRDFGVRWRLNDTLFVAVHAGKSHIHVGVSCKKAALKGSHGQAKLLGHSLDNRNRFSYDFTSYDLGHHEGIDTDVLLGEKNSDIHRALEDLSAGAGLA
jgi:hypothetical protein